MTRVLGTKAKFDKGLQLADRSWLPTEEGRSPAARSFNVLPKIKMTTGDYD